MDTQEETLLRLFEHVKIASMNLQKNAKVSMEKPEGRKFWHKFKVILLEDEFVQLQAKNWEEQRDFPSIKILPDTDEKGETIEINHFLLQQVRIPANDNPTLLKILQVALNIGQLLGYATDAELNEIGYHNFGLESLYNYISKSNASEFSKMIPVKLVDRIIAIN